MPLLLSQRTAARLQDAAFKFFALLFPTVMVYIVTSDSNGCGDLPRDHEFFPLASSLALFLSLVWSLIDRQKKDYGRLRYGLQILTRYFLAYTILQYGAAKVIDMQFSPNLSSLDTRAADMHPMMLAWTFFGYSFPYEFFIGCSQIAAAFLLIFRRTATLGAILMVTIMANVVFVNFAFDVCVRFFSTTYLVMSLYLLVDDAPRLINFLFLNRTAEKRNYPELFKSVRARKAYSVISVMLVMLALGYPLYNTYKVQHQAGVGRHSALYGAWAVDSLHVARDSVNVKLTTGSYPWKKLLFEDFNYLSIKSWESETDNFNYSADSVKQLLTTKRNYSDDTSQLLKARYTRQHDTLYLDGAYYGDSIYVRLHLLRKYFIR
jgi:hypothetical protein